MGLTKGEDIPTPNSNEIVVLPPFFIRSFGLPNREFLCGLLHYYQIELVHLSPNSILKIIIFVLLCEAFLVVYPNFPLFKHYIFLKYQASATNRKVIGGVGIQTHPRSDFLDLLIKTSLKGCHKSWFYYKNHEPDLPSFVGRLLEYNRN
jgi:hypothetical protein